MDNKNGWVVFDEDVVSARDPVMVLDTLRKFDKSKNDRVRSIIETTIAEVRAAISGCSKNTLHPDANRIPHSLVNDACSLFSYYLATAAPGARVLTEDARYQAFSKAQNKLRSIASCEIPVENPSTGSASGGATAAVQVFVAPADKMRMTRSRFCEM